MADERQECLTRPLPKYACWRARRSQASQAVELDLPDTSTLDGVTRSLTAILEATANGKIAPAEAHHLSSVVELQRKAIETVELENRIKRLEQAAARAER